MKKSNMKNTKFIRNRFIKSFGALALSCAVSPFAFAEWSVKGSQIWTRMEIHLFIAV